MKVKATIFSPKKSINRIAGNNKVGIFVAETWGRYFSKYVPMQNGNLDQTRQTEPFKVIYVQPYSNKMHKGSNFHFSKEMHPLAQAHWEVAAFSANKEKVASQITRFVKSQ